MSKDEQGMPFVPEEDLNLHEDFKPIIAENGIIRPKPVPDEEFFTSLGGTFTRMDTIQDLVELRTAEEEAKAKESKKAESPLPEQPSSQDPSSASSTPADFSKQHVPASKATPTESVTQSLPELPRFVQPTSADGAAKGRGKKRILTTVARKTILRLKKKRLKKKKLADSKAAVPPTNPQKPVSQPMQPAPKKPRRWSWVVAILCFLFLGGISSLVPVEKIPLLRSLAYAMGFDKTDTARMSFLRALLTWTDKYITLPGFLQPNEQSRAALWARLYGNAPEDNGTELAGLQGRMASVEGKTSLIDMQTLHALQRQKGRTLDEVRGSVMPIPGQEGEPTATLRDNNVNVRTEASQDKSDVFFGSDTLVNSRTGQEGYDSVNTLKKLANPYITDGHPIDWLTNTAKRLMKADMGLGGINRGLTGTKVNWATGLNDIGNTKPNRDLYHAWITSRMSKYTSNLLLKKALADTSFLGAEMPNTASNVFSFGGVQVDIEALQEDQDAWQEYVEFEKKCKEALQGESDKIANAIEQFNNIVRAGAESLGYPTNCYQARQMTNPPATFTKNASNIQQVCTDLKQGYSSLEEACHMRVAAGETVCESLTGTYADSFYSFKQGCEDEYNTRKQIWEQNWIAAHPGMAVPSYDTEADGWPKEGQTITEVSVGKNPYSSGIIFSQIQKDSKGFATWIRAHCDKDGNCEAENPEDIEALKGTIGDNLLKL